jgi:predicted DNA-binding protein
MSVKIKKEDLETETEAQLHEEEAEEEETPQVETFKATDEMEKVKVLFFMPKKSLEKLKQTAILFDKPYAQIIREAINEYIEKLNNISYLPEVLSDESVDNIIMRLKAKKVEYLTPKALKKIHEFLKDKTTIFGENKWKEFCDKLHIDSDILEELSTVLYLKFKGED